MEEVILKLSRVIIILVFFVPEGMLAGEVTGFERIISNHKEELAGTKDNKKNIRTLKKIEELNVQAELLWNSMDKLIWRTFLWKELADATSTAVLIQNCERLKLLAQALKVPGSKFEKNKKLKDDLIFSLEWIYKNRYNDEKLSQIIVSENAFKIPEAILSIIILMEKDISNAQKEKLMKTIQSQILINEEKNKKKFADLITYAPLTITFNALTKSQKAIDSTLAKLSDLSGLGFYEDGSFISTSKVPSTGTKGVEVFVPISQVMYLISGTNFQLKASAKEIMYRWFFKSFLPLTFQNAFMDFVLGKDISVPDAGRIRYLEFLEGGLLICEQYKEIEIKESFKYCLQKISDKDLILLNFKALEVAKKLLLDNDVESKYNVKGIYIYYEMDKVVAHRQRFSFGISMFSNKTVNYESKNNINLKGRYSNYGATYCYTKNEPSVFISPTIDFYKLPGTTVMSSPRKTTENESTTGKTTWVGGASIDDTYGAVGMDLKDISSSLECKKSWFIFDNEIVALGTGIKATEDDKVLSVVENKPIDSIDYEIVCNKEGLETSQPIVLKNLEWFYLKKKSDSTSLGYYFPTYQDINLELLNRKGKWSDINKSFSKDSLFTKQYISLVYDHGKRPTKAMYQYVMLPSVTKEDLLRYNVNPDVIILDNNEKVQAAIEKTLNIIAANFWTTTHTELSINGSYVIVSDCQASLICMEKDGTLEVSVADPTMLNDGIINIELRNDLIDELISHDELIEIKEYKGVRRISFNVKDTKGKSLKVKFKLNKPETEN